MSDLKAVYTDDRYYFTTLDGNATIELDRIRVDRSGELRAEVEIRWHVRPHDGLLKHGNLNLLADRSIKSWATELEERAEYDWYAVLTAVTKLAKDRYRQGDPPVVLADINPADRPPWFVDPFIQYGGPTVIAAPGGSGKSLFALAFAISVASGHNRILNLALPEARPVLYLDWEADGYQQHDRLAAICRGHKIDQPRGLHYRREYAPITQSAPELVRAIAKLQVGFVVVDSKGAALGGAPEEAEPTLALFRAVRSLNVPCLIVDHVTNEAADKRGGASRPFGSVYTRNMARNVWMAEKGAPTPNRIDVSWTLRKTNDGMEGDQRAWSATISKKDRRYDEIIFAAIDPRSVAQVPDEDRLLSRIVYYLQGEDGWRTNSEIAEATESSINLVAKEIGRHPLVFESHKSGIPHKHRLMSQAADLPATF